MATDFTITFDDGTDPTETPPIDTTAAGVPVGPSTDVDQARQFREAPRREDFRNLTVAISRLARQIGGREERAPERTTERPVTAGPEQESPRERREGFADRLNRTLEDFFGGRRQPQERTPDAPQSLPAGIANQLRAIRIQAGRGILRGQRALSETRIGQAVGNAFNRVMQTRAGQFVQRQGATIAAGARAFGGRVVRGTQAAAETVQQIPGMGRAGAAVAGTVRALGAVGVAAGAAVAGVVALGGATVVAGRALLGMADELERFSGEISAARAQNEAARELQRLELAQRVGPQVAQLVEARGRFDQAFGRLEAGFAEMTATLTPLAEAGIDSAAAAAETANFLKEGVDVIATMGLSAKQREQALDAFMQMNRSLLEIVGLGNLIQTQAQGSIDPLIQELLNTNVNTQPTVVSPNTPPIMPPGP